MTRARDVANLIGSGNYSSTTFTATAGQTAFTISHTQGFVQVFMNGLLLDETVDYTSNGSAVTLTSGAAAGDEIEVVAYNTFSVGDALNQAAADTRYVNTTGDTMSGSLTINTASNGVPSVSLQHSNSDADNFQIMAGTPGVANSGFSIRDTDASANRLIIDSSGRVTTPSQPSFRVGRNAQQTLANATTTKIEFNTVYSQYGSSYSNTNYRFTCPVAGRYLLNWHVYIYSVNNVETKLYKNGSSLIRVAFPLVSSNANPNGSGGSAIVEASANDYFEIWATGYRNDAANFSVYHGSGSESASHFTGMLLG